MKKTISLLIICIFSWGLIGATTVKGEGSKAIPSEYVEVVLPKGSTLKIPSGDNFTVSTDASTTKKYDMYYSGPDIATFNVNLQGTEISTGNYTLYLSTDYGVRFYVPKTQLSRCSVVNTPLYWKQLVKPGESYVYDGTMEKNQTNIILSYDGRFEGGNNKTQLDYVEYDNKGNIKFYDIPEQRISNYNIDIKQGEKVHYSNSSTVDKYALIPTVNKNNVSALKEKVIDRYTLKSGQTITTTGYSGNPNLFGHDMYRIDTKSYTPTPYNSLGYDKDGKLVQVGEDYKIPRTYKTVASNTSSIAIELFAPSKYKQNIIIEEGATELLHTIELYKGETFEFTGETLGNKAMDIRNIDNGRIKYQLIMYGIGNTMRYANSLCEGKDNIASEGGVFIKNTDYEVVKIVIPSIDKNKYKISNKELFAEIDIVPGVKYKGINTNQLILDKLFFNSEYGANEGSFSYALYDNMSNLIEGYASSSFSGVANKSQKIYYSSSYSYTYKLIVPIEVKKFFTKLEDVNSSGVIDITDLASTALKYNVKLTPTNQNTFVYDITCDGIIDIYDIVAIAKAI